MKPKRHFEELYRDISANKLAFFGVFFTIVTLSYAVLYIIDFIPEPIDENAITENSAESVVSAVKNIARRVNGGLVPVNKATEEAEAPLGGVRVVIPDTPTEAVVANTDPLPTKIIFDDLNGKTIDVLNPTSRAIPDLDEALLAGVVRHPDSADFVNVGNIFILGHSSYLPNVFNKNFQAFNEIQSLTWGDTIRLQSGDTEYVYQVDRVYKASASALEVPNSRGVAKLTLATCNSFGSKDDRFMVEASLVETRAL